MRDVGYRSPDEVEAWKAKDPITRLRTRLTADGTATVAELDAIDAEVQALVEEAETFARNSPWPDGATATDHVYAAPVAGSNGITGSNR